MDPAFPPSTHPRTMAGMTTSDTTTLPLAPGRWALDTNHANVAFAVRHLGVAKVRGRFTGFDVDVTIGETLADSSVNATIHVPSLDTANSDRDAHVLSEDILDVAQRPTIEFRSTSITGDGDEWKVVGDVTIGEVSAPVTLKVELGGVEEFPGGGPRHAGFEAVGELRRSDFGIAPNIPSAMLGDVIKFELDLELLEP
jgi:polyisoprenoid-binding protein YceI